MMDKVTEKSVHEISTVCAKNSQYMNRQNILTDRKWYKLVIILFFVKIGFSKLVHSQLQYLSKFDVSNYGGYVFQK